MIDTNCRMRPNPVAVSSRHASQMERRLARLASAMGPRFPTGTSDLEIDVDGFVGEKTLSDGDCVLTTCETLGGILDSMADLQQFRELFLDRMGSLFVVGFADTKWDARVLGEEGSIVKILPVSS